MQPAVRAALSASRRNRSLARTGVILLGVVAGLVVPMSPELSSFAGVVSAPRPAILDESNDSAGDLAAAGTAARTSRKRVEVASATSETARTFANPDGSYTTDLYASPQRVR